MICPLSATKIFFELIPSERPSFAWIFKNEWCPSIGIKYLQDGLGGTWLRTSYNTHKGVHKLNGTPFRKNYAGIGYTYDEVRDAFIPQKPHESWTLNEETCQWEAPIAQPEEVGPYLWNEDNGTWE